MSPRPKAKVYVDIIPAELRARYEKLESKHFDLITASRRFSSDDWAELARIEEAQADLLVELHKLFYPHDALISDVMNRAHVVTRNSAERTRKHADSPRVDQ